MPPSFDDALPTEPAPSRLATWAVHFVLVQLELLSVVLGVSYWVGTSPLSALLASNAWPSDERDRVLLIWVIVAAVGSLAVAVAGYRWGVQAVGKIARLLLPVIPLAFLPALLTTERWFSAQLDYLLILTGFGFLSERCFAHCMEEVRRSAASGQGAFNWLAGLRRQLGRAVDAHARWLPLTTVVVGALLYTSYTGYLTVLNHHRWATGAFDMGIFDNVMFNSLSGHPFRTTIMLPDGAKSFLLCHTPYLLYAFLPLYAIHPGVEALLWIQATVLGAGAVMFFIFARTLIPQAYAAILALLFLLWAPMHGAQFYDFHWLTTAPFYHFFLFYALVRGKAVLIVIATLLLWALREDIAPGLALLGLILLLSGARPKAGLFLALGSSVWFAINKFVIMPSFGTWWFANLYEQLTTPTEKGYGSVIKTLITNPLFAVSTLFNEGKLVYLLHLVVPLAFVPARRLKLALILIPGALFTVLTHAPVNYSIRYQYSSHYAGYVFAAVVIYLRDLDREKDSAFSPRVRALSTLAGIAFCMICHTATYGVVIKPSSFMGATVPIAFSLTAEERAHKQAFEELARLIPENASVTATTKDSPHLTNHLEIYAFGHSRRPSEYLLINPSSFGMGSTNQDILAVLDGQEYGLVKKARGIMLWKRGHGSPETEAELKRLKRRLGGSRRR